MSAFEEANIIEARALLAIIPFLKDHSCDGRFVLTNKGTLSKELQKTAGDALLNTYDGKVWGVELKSETENIYNNFFLETWSNLSRFTPGWMFTLNTDILLYYFLTSGDLYSISFPNLRKWAFTDKKIYLYPEKQQGKYKQLNDTWGRCVPIVVIKKEVGFTQYHLEEDTFRKVA